VGRSLVRILAIAPAGSDAPQVRRSRPNRRLLFFAAESRLRRPCQLRAGGGAICRAWI